MASRSSRSIHSRTARSSAWKRQGRIQMAASNVVKVPSGSKLGIGFSRAVRVGDLVFGSGCAPIAADGSVAAPGDMKGQTKRCFEIIEAALQAAGADLKHVVRTRIFLTDMSR